MKRFFLFLTACYLLLAQPALAADPFQQLEEKYQNVASFSADFVQETTIELLEQTKQQSGHLILAPKRFRIEYQKPKAQHYVYDGQTLWIYTPQHKEVEIYEEATREISEEALDFLGGLGNLKKRFRLARTEKKSGQIQFTLIPKKKKLNFKEVILSVAEKDLVVQEVTLIPKQGNRSHYRFSDVKTGGSVSEKTFTFEIPRGVKTVRP